MRTKKAKQKKIIGSFSKRDWELVSEACFVAFETYEGGLDRLAARFLELSIKIDKNILGKK